MKTRKSWAYRQWLPRSYKENLWSEKMRAWRALWKCKCNELGRGKEANREREQNGQGADENPWACEGKRECREGEMNLGPVFVFKQENSWAQRKREKLRMQKTERTVYLLKPHGEGGKGWVPNHKTEGLTMAGKSGCLLLRQKWRRKWQVWTVVGL